MPRFRETKVGEILNQAVARKKVLDRVRTVDAAGKWVLENASDGIITSYDRYLAQQPQCSFGLTGICCRNCVQGPCRIFPTGEAKSRGICGATAYTIVARGLARGIAGGASSHSDHGRHMAKTLLEVAEGRAPDYKISDPAKLRRVALKVGINPEGKSDRELAKEVALKALNDYYRFDEKPLTWLDSYITPGRRAKFKHTNITPTNLMQAITDVISQTVMGMDADPVNIIFGGLKTALADFTGMHIATDMSDILFGTPEPVATEANLGVLEEEYINVATHGHNPTLSDMIVEAAIQLEPEAIKAGAKGIKIVGVCCTGNELLMRKGIPLAANQASQELAIMTGAVDAMVVDVQCFLPSLKVLSDNYHTRLITTAVNAKIPTATHIDFNEEEALELAKDIVRQAIEAYKRRNKDKIRIPKEKTKALAGFSTEAIEGLLAAVNPEQPWKVLTDAIESGELAGVVLFAGCNNQKVAHDEGHITVAKHLAKNNVLLLATGCAAGALAKAGLTTPGAVEAYAGEGLKSFLKRLEEAAKPKYGLPLVFHQGSCVDNVRGFDLAVKMAETWGIDLPKVPFAVSAPEDMHEKALSIGSWFVTMGFPVHVGVMPPIEGSELVYSLATQIAYDVFGGSFIFDTEPESGAKKLVDALDYRTWKLRIHRAAAEKYNTSLAVGY